MSRDYREVVIETLADSEAALLDRIVELTVERDAYRLIAQQAIHALHDLTIERDRLRARLYRLLDETRALRAAQREAA